MEAGLKPSWPTPLRHHAAQPVRRSFNQRRRVLRSRLLETVLVHGMVACLMAYAATQQMLDWAVVAALTALAATGHAGLLAMLRTGRPRHGFDPALFGPITLLSMTMLAAACWSGAAPYRLTLVASLAPLLLLAGVHVRGTGLRWLVVLGSYTASAALLAFSDRHVADPSLSASLAALLLAPLLVVRAAGRLKGLSCRTAAAWIVSNEKHQRIFIVRYLMGCVNAAAGVAALQYGVRVGDVAAEPARWLSWLGFLAIVGFYSFSRLGLNKRLRDPGMTEPKILVAISFLAAGYYMGGPGRSIALLLLVTIQMFGMFVITPTQVARTSLYAIAAFGVSMVAVDHYQPGAKGADMQALFFCVLIVILSTTSWLANQLGKLRNTLRARKNELAEALERIQVLATRDELTGLFNRRHMTELLHRQMQIPQPLCIALVDIDHFKRINDSHGHRVGDEVLQNFGKALAAGLGQSAIVARWGGEEFLVMIPGCKLDEARASLERTRLEVERTRMSPGTAALRVTFSGGLAEYQHGEELEQAIERADQGLYAAKKSGRNRTVTKLLPFEDVMQTARKEAASTGW